MSVGTGIKCAGCKRRIPAHAPALIIGDLSPDAARVVRRLHFHEMCAPAAIDFLTERRGRSRSSTAPWTRGPTDMRRVRKSRLSQTDLGDLRVSPDLVRRRIAAKKTRHANDSTREGGKG